MPRTLLCNNYMHSRIQWNTKCVMECWYWRDTQIHMYSYSYALFCLLSFTSSPFFPCYSKDKNTTYYGGLRMKIAFKTIFLIMNLEQKKKKTVFCCYVFYVLLVAVGIPGNKKIRNICKCVLRINLYYHSICIIYL